jgi:hypothetical protein
MSKGYEFSIFQLESVHKVCQSVMPDLRSLHRTLDTGASRDRRKDWIPAFAGMTPFYENRSLWTGT